MDQHMVDAISFAGIPPQRLTRAQLDPLQSAVLMRELPGLAAALDESIMCGQLQDLLFGARSRFQIERCNPGQAIYLGGDFCGLRYEMEVRDQMTGELSERLVIGRVFQDRDACAAFLRDKVAPIAAQVAGRAEFQPFVATAGLFEPLSLVVHTFPIDGDLPVLVDVTDPESALALLNETLPGAREGSITWRSCDVELAHYGRQHRCTLRYTLAGSGQGGTPITQVVYGKIAADGSGARTGPLISLLREQLGMSQVNIPRILGFREAEQLLLLEAIPGKPQVARLLKARLAGKEPGGDLTLEAAVRACGQIAAAIHGVTISVDRERTMESEIVWLHQSIQTLGRVSPELGARLQRWLEQIAVYARNATPLPLCFSHGDFTYTQLIFDGQQHGLVDFDTVCRAEPALDLGQFLAYQRLAILKDQRPDAPVSAHDVEQLCAHFFNAYCAARSQPGDLSQLRARAAVYELLMLLRLAIHSWQKLKVSRLEHTLTLLEERVPCLH
jgi:hypothetical protein